jgi:hypothetical protein
MGRGGTLLEVQGGVHVERLAAQRGGRDRLLHLGRVAHGDILPSAAADRAGAADLQQGGVTPVGRPAASGSRLSPSIVTPAGGAAPQASRIVGTKSVFWTS